MGKFSFAFVLLFGFSTALAQENQLVHYAGLLPGNDIIYPSYDTISCEIVFYSSGKSDIIRIKIDSLNGGLIVTTDSIFFSVSIPRNKFIQSDSFLIKPYFSLDKSIQVKGPDDGVLIKGSTQMNTTLKVKINTKPIGASVYFIPRYKWVLKPEKYWLSLPLEVKTKPVPEGPTPVITTVQPYVYMVLFVENGKVEYMEYAAQPNNTTITYSFTQK